MIPYSTLRSLALHALLLLLLLLLLAAPLPAADLTGKAVGISDGSGSVVS